MAMEVVAAAVLSMTLSLAHEFLDIKNEVLDMLVDAEMKQVQDDEKRNWLKDLDDVVYDVDELIAYYFPRLEVRTFFSCPNNLVLRFKMAHKLKKIKAKLYAIYSDMNEIQSDATKGRYENHSDVPLEEEVIGRDGDREAIIKRLLDPELKEDADDVNVVPIVGLGGSGKTTLARLVYKDEKVQTHFDLRMWVTAPEDFDPKSLAEKIIKSADNKGTENLEMDQLVKELQKIISGKRYLLVLDGVLEVESWFAFKRLLSNGAKGSSIIITTRSFDAARMTSPEGLYVLDKLDEDASWSLFKKVAFEPGQEPSDSSDTVEMAKKCGGNPLAIKSIGSMLRFKNLETGWLSISNMEFSKIPQQEHDIFETLRLSFYSLPSHLKHCFAYCGIFPRECVIDVQTLINLWMAQGFICTSYDMLDVGYEYFYQLLQRSFFQDVQRDEHGMLTKCKMHSLMHRLAITVAGTRCSMLSSQNKDKIDREAHHLSFNFHLDSHWQIPASLVRAKGIRTILLLNQSQRWETEGRSGKSICGNMVLGCKRLHALDLHNSGINIVPSSIGKLKLLRYLDLSRNMNIKTLPGSVTKLYHLQTLKLNFCQRLQELPRDIKKLINLRNLEIEGCYNLAYMPCGLGQLTKLRTLSEFVLSKETDLDSGHKAGGLEELRNVDNLRGELRIKNLRHGVEYEAANLEKKTRLVSLILIWNNDDLEAMKAVANGNAECSNREMNVEHSYLRSLNGLKPHAGLKELSLSAYGGVRFPDWFSSLKRLVKVSLWGCEKWQHISLQHQLDSLVVLTLAKLTSLEYILLGKMSRTIFLPRLKEVRLTNLPNLKGWWRPPGENEGADATSFKKATSLLTALSCQAVFLQLSKLVIENCPKLDFMPLFPNLDEVLQLNNSSWKLFQQTMTMSVAGQQIPKSTTAITEEASPSSSLPGTSTFSPLSKLRNLCLVDMMELDISNSDVVVWEAFESLRCLTFDHLPKLKTLPEGLQKVNRLQELHIRRCNNLEAIPDWIKKLKQLKKLALRLLPNLTSLPEELYGRTDIEDCPKIPQKAYPVQDLIKKLLTTSEDEAMVSIMQGT